MIYKVPKSQKKSGGIITAVRHVIFLHLQFFTVTVTCVWTI